jgi:sugar lactone lactonase YvrE
VLFATLPVATEVAPDGKQIKAQWIHGLASGPDHCLYYSEQRAVRRISPDGEVSLVAGEIKVPDCIRPPGAADDRLGPSLRGLAVKSDGTIFVAASACSAVLRVTPKGAVDVELRASESWTPTGVAVSGDDLLVLEYLLTDTHRREDWLPRVRKVSRDGSVTVVATVNKDLRRTTESAGTRAP